MTARRPHVLALTAILACGLFAVWAATRNSFFFADDWLNFGQAQQTGMGIDLLKLGYFGHFAPGHRVIDWMLLNWFSTSWAAYLAIMLGFQALAVAAFWVLVRSLDVPLRPALATTALIALSVVWARATQWDASAAHVVPASALTVLSLAAAAAWMRTPRWWLSALCTLGMLGGVLFYEKPVLIIGYVVLLRWVLLPSLSPRAIVSAARRDLPLLAPLLILAAVYSYVVLSGGYSSTGPGVSASVWIDYLWRTWTEGTITMLVGQGSPEYAPAIPLGLRILAQLVLVVLVVWSVRRSRSAWRAWAFLLVVWGVNVGLLGIGRLGGFGAGIGLDPRYYAEMSYLLPLAVALAFRPPGGAAPATARASDGPLLPAGTRMRVAVAAAAVLFLVSTANAYDRLNDHWEGKAARTWATNLRETADAARDRSGTLSILEGDVPYKVVAINSPPFNRRSLVVPMLVDGRIAFDGGGERPAVLDDDGRVVPLSLDAVAGGDVLRTATGARVLEGPARRSADGICADGAPVLVRVPAAVTLEGTALARVVVDPQDGPRLRGLELSTDRGTGLPTGGYERAILVGPRAAAGGVQLDVGALRAFAIRVPAGTCLRAASLVQVS